MCRSLRFGVLIRAPFQTDRPFIEAGCQFQNRADSLWITHQPGIPTEAVRPRPKFSSRQVGLVRHGFATITLGGQPIQSRLSEPQERRGKPAASPERRPDRSRTAAKPVPICRLRAVYGTGEQVGVWVWS